MIERVLTSHLVDFELLNADSIIVNCGAGDGDFARILHARTGATVHCYEPFPEENRLAPDYGLRIYPFAIGEMSGDPGIGLAFGAEPRLERHHPAAITALCSRSFRDALQRIETFLFSQRDIFIDL